MKRLIIFLALISILSSQEIFCQIEVKTEVSNTTPYANQVFEVKYSCSQPCDSIVAPLTDDFIITESIIAKTKITSGRDTISEVRCLMIPRRTGEVALPKYTFYLGGEKTESSEKTILIHQRRLPAKDSLLEYQAISYPDKIVLYSLMHSGDTRAQNDFKIKNEYKKLEAVLGEPIEITFATDDLGAVFEPPDFGDLVLVASPVEMIFSKVSSPYKTISYKLQSFKEVVTVLNLTVYFSNGVVMESEDMLVIVGAGE